MRISDWSSDVCSSDLDAASFTLLLLVVAMSGLRRAPQEHETEETTLLADYRPLLGNRRVMVVTGALSLEVFATAIADVVISSGLKRGETIIARAPPNLQPGTEVISADKARAQPTPTGRATRRRRGCRST